MLLLMIFRCRSGWTGQRCNETVKSVESPIMLDCNLECKNGGTCVIEKGQATCKCDRKLYEGDLCQIRVIRPCEVVTQCLNGGSCLADGSGCLCPPGYTGDRCQTKRLSSQCGHVTCYNGGTCYIDNQNEYACHCHISFSGKYCQIKLNACGIHDICKNGAACRWYASNASYECLCKSGFGGNNCEFSLATTSKSRTEIITRVENTEDHNTNKKIKESPISEDYSLLLIPLIRKIEKNGQLKPDSHIVYELKEKQTKSADSISASLTVEEIVLIVLLGILLPVFVILIVLISYKRIASKRSNKNEQMMQTKQHNFYKALKKSLDSKAVPNIYFVESKLKEQHESKEGNIYSEIPLKSEDYDQESACAYNKSNINKISCITGSLSSQSISKLDNKFLKTNLRISKSENEYNIVNENGFLDETYSDRRQSINGIHLAIKATDKNNLSSLNVINGGLYFKESHHKCVASMV
jgi:hypothetical protein